jgi:hypothetical protein
MAEKKKPSSRIYFSEETEDAIVEYNNCEDYDEREIIFRGRIQRPLDKLAENIINRFKFPYMDGTFDDIKIEVVSFLVLNLHKYAKEKGKAFSYFSVIAKNYLILNNNNRYKQEKRSLFLSDTLDGQASLEEVLMIDDQIADSKKDAAEFTKLMIEFWDHNLTRIFKKKRDIKIADAIIELFRRVEGIENFNKKALYLLVREMTGCKTSNITKVVNKMGEYIQDHLHEYKNRGTVTDIPPYFTY